MKWLFGWSKFGFLILGVFIIAQRLMPESDFSNNNRQDGSKQVDTLGRKAGSEQRETGEYLVIPPGEGEWETIRNRRSVNVVGNVSRLLLTSPSPSP